MQDTDHVGERRTTQRALAGCARWLSDCLRLGWSKADLDALEALWWKYHDHRGNLYMIPKEPKNEE
jgi:hypothetical protein